MISRNRREHGSGDLPPLTLAEVRALGAVGQRVRFVRDVERFPHARILAGELGEISFNDGDQIAVTPDKHRPELCEWGGEILWTDDDEIREFMGDVEFIP